MRLFFRKAWCWLAIARQRYRTRQQLAQLDDRALQDIGLSRADACQEAEKPFGGVMDERLVLFVVVMTITPA
ncbi:MAG: DUF1127 domain-containing protein [Hahellaceae bacterium]|nr:DUF1127 domain-containing protein [Hahellaceae bacterium]